MNIQRNISSSLLATSIMTIFSDAVSAVTHKEFNEPVLLGDLIRRLGIGIPKQPSRAIGWVAHYGVGLAFTAAYELLWKKTTLRPTLMNGMWIGLASGIIGGYAWKKALDLHPNPPRIDMREHYAQLVPAHVVFALVDVLVRGRGQGPIPISYRDQRPKAKGQRPKAKG